MRFGRAHGAPASDGTMGMVFRSDGGADERGESEVRTLGRKTEKVSPPRHQDTKNKKKDLEPQMNADSSR